MKRIMQGVAIALAVSQAAGPALAETPGADLNFPTCMGRPWVPCGSLIAADSSWHRSVAEGHYSAADGSTVQMAIFQAAMLIGTLDARREQRGYAPRMPGVQRWQEDSQLGMMIEEEVASAYRRGAGDWTVKNAAAFVYGQY